ncbi:MAG TPA: hypothetical protein ENJ08_14180 [Gammaproteobacteria bacterium]|nr:hypothetical protein [Gammaproteobacteria bacterium]
MVTKKLALWVGCDLKQRFENKIIPVDLAVEWGRVQGRCEKKGLAMSAINGLIAVSVLVYQCTVVTSNTGPVFKNQVHQSGVALLNLRGEQK